MRHSSSSGGRSKRRAPLPPLRALGDPRAAVVAASVDVVVAPAGVKALKLHEPPEFFLSRSVVVSSFLLLAFLLLAFLLLFLLRLCGAFPSDGF